MKITEQPTLWRASLRIRSTVGVVLALVGAWGTAQCRAASSDQAGSPRTESTDPWPASALVEPLALAKSLSTDAGKRPLVYCVGFPFLYQSGHIPGARFAGPASRPEGVQALRHDVEDLSRSQSIVLYCGCCPWKDCPNIRPAYRALQELGFHSVRVLVLPENFRQDWIAKGLPVQKGGDAN